MVCYRSAVDTDIFSSNIHVLGGNPTVSFSPPIRNRLSRSSFDGAHMDMCHLYSLYIEVCPVQSDEYPNSYRWPAS